MLEPKSRGVAFAARLLDSRVGSLPFFVLLFLLHADALRLGPSEDQARGIWTEAALLYQSDFDYSYLNRHAQFYSGPSGERGYIVSVLPTVIAGLRVITGSASATILAYKLFTLACGAIAAHWAYGLARRHLDVGESFLVALVALTIPPVACQIDMLGMELPAMVPLMFAVRATVDERYLPASGWFLIAGFVKLASVVFVFAAVAYLLLLFAIRLGESGWKGRWRSPLAASGLFAVVFAIQVYLFSQSGQADPADQYRPMGPRLLRPIAGTDHGQNRSNAEISDVRGSMDATHQTGG